ncbi:hypothetical protein G3565_34830, partial [Escherichia coli]|nr:hypothetical protein [Escherichia coli]
KELISEIARLKIEDKATKNNLISKITTLVKENEQKSSEYKKLLTKLETEDKRITKFIGEEHANKQSNEELLRLYSDNILMLESLL